MDKKALYNLLGKYLNNTCSQEERELVNNWLELLQENKTFAAYTRSDLDAIHNRIWQKIKSQTYQNTKIEKPVLRRSIGNKVTRWAVAASIVAILSLLDFAWPTALLNHKVILLPLFLLLVCFGKLIPPAKPCERYWKMAA